MALCSSCFLPRCSLVILSSHPKVRRQNLNKKVTPTRSHQTRPSFEDRVDRCWPTGVTPHIIGPAAPAQYIQQASGDIISISLVASCHPGKTTPHSFTKPNITNHPHHPICLNPQSHYSASTSNRPPCLPARAARRPKRPTSS